MIDRIAVTGILLCGGEGRRMGGEDKPLMQLAGRPLVAHVHARLAPQVSGVVLSCNRHRERYAAWGDAVVTDEVPFLGPLGGLVSALAAVHTPWAFTCAGDMPLLDAHLAERLWDARAASGAELAYAHDGERAHPLCLLLQAGAAASIRAYLDRGERSVMGWLATRHACVVDCADIAASFANANTPEALAQLEDRWARLHRRT